MALKRLSNTPALAQRAMIDFGPVFVGTSRDGRRALEQDRLALFSGHSLRASSAEVDERYVQKQLGHASAEMTRRYQRRRDRFRVNLTKAAGL